MFNCHHHIIFPILSGIVFLVQIGLLFSSSTLDKWISVYLQLLNMKLIGLYFLPLPKPESIAASWTDSISSGDEYMIYEIDTFEDRPSCWQSTFQCTWLTIVFILYPLILIVGGFLTVSDVRWLPIAFAWTGVGLLVLLGTAFLYFFLYGCFGHPHFWMIAMQAILIPSTICGLTYGYPIVSYMAIGGWMGIVVAQLIQDKNPTFPRQIL